jgi:competence protein ComEA
MKKLLAGLVLSLSMFSSGLALAMGSVNINQASAQELANALSGVGMAKAQAIVDYREMHGPFESIQDLVKVSGIGLRIYEMNESKLRLAEGD